jgi:hypothetical protein
MQTLQKVRTAHARRVWVSFQDDIGDFPNAIKASTWLASRLPALATVAAFNPRGVRVVTFDGTALDIQFYWSDIEGNFSHPLNPQGQLQVCKELLSHHFATQDFSIHLNHTPTIPLSAVPFIPPSSQQKWYKQVGLFILGTLGFGLYFSKLRYRTNWLSLPPSAHGKPISVKYKEGQWHLMRGKVDLIAHPDLGQALSLAARIQFTEAHGKKVELPAL